MGLAAPQARLLTLQSRMSDLELRCMQLSNEQITNSIKTSNLSIQYNKKLEAANAIGADIITTNNTRAGSSSTTSNTLKFNNKGTYVDLNYSLLKQLGYDIAPAGTSGREAVTQKTTETAAVGGTYDKATGKWTMPTTVDEFAKLMMAAGCADAYVTGSDNPNANTLNMTKYLDENGNIVEGGNANSPHYWANKFAKNSVADDDVYKTSFNSTTAMEFDVAKLTKLLGSAPVEADSTQTTENVVSYEYDTNDIIDEAKQNAQALIEGLMNGSIGIFKEGYQVSLDQVGVENLEVVDNTTNWSETSFLQTLDYSARDKARQEAQSWFDSQTAILSREEKVIEIKKKSADTEYQAATTEYESVKQLISDNSERSFSIWS